MIRKNRLNKIFIIVSLLISLTLILYSILRALETNIDLYLTPTQVESGEYSIDKSFKLGGMVKKESLKQSESLEIKFTVTDFNKEIEVVYIGILPNLFKENSGVVASGYLDKEKKVFIADEILAKHDETYMPIKIEVQD
jgi:cytochrome c-type biogenesis protein CcmE|tara:strand:- start:2960 stop:3376 length:417 start_codon:yes stop_codon:yes gene_type:complete